MTQVLIEKKGVDKVDALKEIAKKLIEAAMNGEQWAIKELADRLDGKAIQQTEVNLTADITARAHQLSDDELATIAAGKNRGA